VRISTAGTEPPQAAKKARGTDSISTWTRPTCMALVATYKRVVADHAHRVPRIREQMDLAIRAVFDSWNAPRAIRTAGERIGRSGHGGQRGRDGVRQPRDGLRDRVAFTATRPPVRAYTATLQNAQARTSSPASATVAAAGAGRIDPRLVPRAARHHGEAGESLPQYMRHEFYDRRESMDAGQVGSTAARVRIATGRPGLIDLDEALGRVTGAQLTS
jgi:pyruvate,orthophosphate dikinase